MLGRNVDVSMLFIKTVRQLLNDPYAKEYNKLLTRVD